MLLQLLVVNDDELINTPVLIGTIWHVPGVESIIITQPSPHHPLPPDDDWDLPLLQLLHSNLERVRLSL